MNRIMHSTVLALAMLTPFAAVHAQQESCGYDWACWEMFPYAEVPVWTNDDAGTPAGAQRDPRTQLRAARPASALLRKQQEAERAYERRRSLAVWPAPYTDRILKIQHDRRKIENS